MRPSGGEARPRVAEQRALERAVEQLERHVHVHRAHAGELRGGLAHLGVHGDLPALDPPGGALEAKYVKRLRERAERVIAREGAYEEDDDEE